MKKIFWILLVFFISIEGIKAQTVRDSILAVNFTYYLDKPIDSLINKLPTTYDSIYTRAGSSTFKGAKIVLKYSNSNTWVYIYPGTHDYFTPLNSPYNPPHIAWPLHLVRKEKTWMVVVWGLEAEPLVEICCGD